jgi:hypothetical protein
MNIQFLSKNLKIQKVILLLSLVLFFSIIYMFLEDKEFSGINNIQEIIKNEIIKEKVKKEIKENFKKFEQKMKDEAAIDKVTKETKEHVNKKELIAQKFKPNLYQKFFDRIYFSAITGSTLGYGDIYPISNTAKFLVLIQALSTIIIIIF